MFSRFKSGVGMALFPGEEGRGRRLQKFLQRRSKMDTDKKPKKPICETPNSKTCPSSTIQPDKNHNWVNLAENEWDELLPVGNEKMK